MTHLLATVAQVLAALTAEDWARRRPEHRPVALALMGLAVASLLRAGLAHGVLAGPGPYSGWHRVAFHIEEALFLLSPALLTWLAIVVFGGPRKMCPLAPSQGIEEKLHRAWRTPAEPIAVVWLSLLAAIVIGYPALRGDALRRVYLGAEFGSLFVTMVAALAWARRGGWRDISPTVLVVLCIVAVELVELVTGPWRRGLYGSAWETAQAGQVVLYLALTALQLGALASRPR